MKARLFLKLDQIRSAYWFIPSLMLSGGALLAVVLMVVDQNLETENLQGAWWIFSGGAEGARTLLSTVAGSVIGVAGTTFSITIAVLSLTSSQFGPRLLRGFLRDTANQIVLGTFVGTFLYCLLVLRMVRSVEEAAFVPHVAVTGGAVLAIASIGVLIFFIHHVSTSIQASQIIANAAGELEDAISRLFGKDDADGWSGSEDVAADAEPAAGAWIPAAASGYVQALDSDALVALAARHDVLLRLRHKPGQFVIRGTALADAWPPDALDAEARAKITDAFHLGDQRTSSQDMEFLILQLVEIAVRALSPGTNDPFTAVMCLDRLGEALCRLANRPFPSPKIRDADGAVRVIVPAVTFSDLTELAFSEIRHYGSSDPLVAAHLLSVTGAVAECAPAGERRDNLIQLLASARTAALAGAHEEITRSRIEEIYRGAMLRLNLPTD